MNGEIPNNQANEFNNGGVLGSAQPVSPVGPVPDVAPVQAAPAAPVPDVAPVQAAPAAPVPDVAPVQAAPAAPVPDVAPVQAAPAAPVPEVAPVQAAPAAPVPEVASVQAAPAAPVPDVASVQAAPAAPVPDVASAQAAPTGPTPQPIPGTDAYSVAQSNGTNLSASQNANYLNQQKVTNIGTVPPTNDTKEKKPMNKIVFIAIIVVLVLGVAFGVYYVLKLSKKKLELKVKDVQIMSNVDVPTNLSFYATVVKGDATDCKVDVTGVNSSKTGSYEVIITCGDNKYTSKVTVVDKTPPVLLTNIVFKKVNDEISLSDFISSCDDNESECTTSFVNEESVKGQLQSVGGPIDVEIEAKDSTSNSVIANGILYVTDVDPYVYTRCSSSMTNQTIDNYKVNKQVEDVLAIGESDSNYFFLNYARRLYRYVFESMDDYKNVTATMAANMTFDGVTGHASFDDENSTLTISIDLPKSTLESENGGEFPSGYLDIKQLYTSKDYSCNSVKNTGPIIN